MCGAIVKIDHFRCSHMPAEFARSVTGTQGKELASHKNCTVATGNPSYFQPPLQRGPNENTNGLLRHCMPKVRPLEAQCHGLAVI